MAFWLLKSEPDVYSYADLERDGSTIWDGIANNAALKYMRSAQVGDLALIYHTGDERQAMGIAEITSTTYPDPKESDPKLLVFDLRAIRRLAKPVTLAAIKADPFFAGFELIRQARLSVVPVTPEQWQRILAMAEA
ncbi:MAG: EVE domain-containing protein [Roseiflexaceae bacterium]